MELKKVPSEFDGQIEILSVEDTPSDQALIAHALKSMTKPYRLNFISDGEDAVRYLRKEGRFFSAPRPHFILLDLNLPGKHGHDVLQEIRNDVRLKDIPVMVLSTSQSNDDAEKCYALRANFFTKPTDFQRYNVVLRAIENFCVELDRVKQSELSEDTVTKALELEKEARRNERRELKTKIWELERQLLEEKRKTDDIRTSLGEKQSLSRPKDLL